MSNPAGRSSQAGKGSSKGVLRWTLIIGGVLLLFVMIGFAFVPKAIPVELGEVAQGSLRVTIDEEGKTRIQDRYVVSTPVAGRLQRIELDPGQSVVAGETVIAILVPSDPALLDARNRSTAEAQMQAASAGRDRAVAEVERARVTLDFAEKALVRSQELARQQTRVIDEQSLEQAQRDESVARVELRSREFALRVAESEYEQARAVFAWAEAGDAEAQRQFALKAPATGKILRVLRDSEGFVAAGTPLVEVGDPAALEVVVDLLSSDAVRVSSGDRVRIVNWGGEESLRAEVRLVEPSGFTKVSALGVEEQRVNVIVDPMPPLEGWRRLGDGFRVEVQIAIWDQESVTQVPVTALFRKDGGWAVFRALAGRAEWTDVEVGNRNDFAAEVLRGLSSGDSVILYPSELIDDGAKISPR